jgi:hypothetical protein
VPGEWLNSLKEEEGKHNTAAALREARVRRPIGPATRHKTSRNPPSETSKTPNGHRTKGKNLQTRQNLPSETSETPKAGQLGLVATWSAEFGYISLHDPATGDWHDLKTTDAPGWAVGEARRRKELYKSGNRRAYRLTAHDMEALWKNEEPAEEGIVEGYPVEGV